MSIDSASPTVSASHKVCLLLKEHILTGEYVVGTFLPPEDELIRNLGVSRTSLREGIKQMEALGWLQIERGNGTRVRKPDFTVLDSCLEFHARFELLRFEDVHAMRRLIELEVVSQITPLASAEFIEELRAANKNIFDQRDQKAGYIDADVAFHDVMINACPNPIYKYIMQGFRKYLALSRQLSYSGPESVIETVKAHERIIDAIASGSVQQARETLLDHISVTEGQLQDNRQ
ncbi:MAG: FadR family transcriptional regulator [Planctomycetes bacterium]|nr:FadR family transcriptional regulator [Planctomycetota bacterium]